MQRRLHGRLLQCHLRTLLPQPCSRHKSADKQANEGTNEEADNEADEQAYE